MEDYKYKQGQLVEFRVDENISGTGKIVGAATTPLYGMGRVWHIDLGNVRFRDYPFSVVAVNEPAITPIDKD